MKLDLTSLAKSIMALESAVAVIHQADWFNAQIEAVQNTLMAGVIQNFECVYELSIKMIRRRITMDAAGPTEGGFADFRDLLRSAAEQGLIEDVTAWFEYRTLRNITAHTYDLDRARHVYQGVGAFIGSAKALLAKLDVRRV